MVENKIDSCIEMFSTGGCTVKSYDVKYLGKFGFASVYYKVCKVLDIASITSILKFIEYERFKLSGKKAIHLDLSEHNYEKSVKSVIEDYLIPFNGLGNLKCIFNEENHNLVILSDDDNEYFDEVREFLGI